MAISIFPSTAAEFVSNNFVIDMNDTTNNTAEVESIKQAGPYAISLSSGDATFDVYFIDSEGNRVGYSNGTSITATGLFNTVVILGVSTSEIVSFNYQGEIINTDGEGDETAAGAYLESVTPARLVSIDDTATVTGGNFSGDTQIFFESGATSLPAKNITVVSQNELLITRPDGLVTEEFPYTLRAVNTGVPEPTGSNANLLVDAITNLGASGGQEFVEGGFKYHLFTASDDIQVQFDGLEVEYLVVAGGGGGGDGTSGNDSRPRAGGGGGGAGGLLNGSLTLGADTYSIAIGAGGSELSDGTDTTFSTLLTAVGGGAGGSGTVDSDAGNAGGSGGGAGGRSASGTTPGGLAVNSGAQGKNGGSSREETQVPEGSSFESYYPGGGGGGAGFAGQNLEGFDFVNEVPGADGGDGLEFADFANATSTGDQGYYAGGGGSGRKVSGADGAGGLGGGDSKSVNTGGQANTGGGGAGSQCGDLGADLTGTAGGSGIVIVRYAF